MTPAPLDGVLVVDKPEGPTSHDVVAVLRRCLPRKTRVGHTGTLDPLATGVMAIVIGRATRLAQFLASDRKRYLATIAFGTGTTTYDRAGDITATASSDALARLDAPAIEAVLTSLTGTQLQIPPAHSAKKVDGHRAYDLVRGGADVTLAPVEVTAYALGVVSWDAARHVAVVDVESSAGFYVRSLVNDVGARLGVPAHLAALRRIASGEFSLAQVHDLGAIVSASIDTLASWVIPPGQLLPTLPSTMLTEDQVRAIRNGLAIRPAGPVEAVPLIRLLDCHGALIALAVPAPDMPGLWQPRIVLGV